MTIKTTTNIDVDFYDKKYILVNAKQLDRGAKFLDEGIDSEGNEYSRWLDNGSRFFSVTCYYQGKLIVFNSGEHAAYIRYKKPDGYAVFNFCKIDNKGKIIVGLTEQMLASDGICVADLVIVDKGKAKVNLDTGEIINIDETSVLSTMPIHIDVTEVAVNNSDIESTYEFNLLNTNLEKYWANFEDVIKTSKSWAVGNTGIRDGENTDNAKYYSEQSSNSANASKTSETNALNNANMAKSYAIGGTGLRQDEDTNNSYYYYERVKSIINGLDSGFIPMGTISFEELSSVEKVTGYVYNIRDNFVTDESFAEGSGKSYTAGVNVYCRSDGLWDCFGGSSQSIATLSEVREYLGI